MLFAILSLLLGALTFIGANFSVSKLLAALGLSALRGGVNYLIKFSSILGIIFGIWGLIRERIALDRQREIVETMCIIGALASAIPYLITLQKMFMSLKLF